MHAIVVSRRDAAGLNIKEHLIASGEFQQSPRMAFGHTIFSSLFANLYTVETDSIFSDQLSVPEPIIIFATKHQSISKIPSFTVHSVGNWSYDTSHGGQGQTLGISVPALLTKGFHLISHYAKEISYDPFIEATHHGPTLSKPCMFIEIGSTEAEWTNPEAGKQMAYAIIELCKNPLSEPREVLIGIGGLHSSPRFCSYLEKHPQAVIGHICPKYMLEHLTSDLIEQALSKSSPPATRILVDWKGLKEHKEKIKELLGNREYEKI